MKDKGFIQRVPIMACNIQKSSTRHSRDDFNLLRITVAILNVSLRFHLIFKLRFILFKYK